MIVTLEFEYYAMLESVLVEESLRLSIWSEDNQKYLMPTQFERVFKRQDGYNITVISIDPAMYVSDDLIGKKFYFGHPGKIAGIGVLKKIISIS